MYEIKDMFYPATVFQNRLKQKLILPATETDCREICDYIDEFFSVSQNYHRYCGLTVADLSDVIVDKLHCYRLQITATRYNTLVFSIILYDWTLITYIFYEDGSFSQVKSAEVPKRFLDIIESWGIGITKNLKQH